MSDSSSTPLPPNPDPVLNVEITQELIDAQGKEVTLDGYYLPDDNKASSAMRPSKTFNDILDSLS